MKITRKQLAKFIREEFDASDLPDRPEDVETVEDAWAGGDDLVQAVDYSKVITGESNVDEPEVLDIIVKEVRRRINEKKDGNKATVKYNADPALKGDQTKLPDHLQKGIIDKANEGEGKLKEIDGADHDGSLMDLDDYYELEDLLTVQLRDLLRGGYSKADLIQALTNIVNDAL